MELLKREDLEEISKEKEEEYYIPANLFDGMQYKLVRLEVKWAYVACLNVMLKAPQFDKSGQAYIKDDSPMIIETLKKIANKKVDGEKIQGYLNELEDLELLQRDHRNIYLKKIVSIF